MSTRAFTLSDCEYPECLVKPYALLTANPTKVHHFVAQTEQRQHAFNPEVSPKNRNVYRLPLTLFHKPHHGEVKSVNIENNLSYHNLYTLTFEQGDGGRQYNLENWFNRYESGYEEACSRLRHLPEGSRNVPEELWRVLKLKMLGVLRNPNNRSDRMFYEMHRYVHEQLPNISSEFTHLISARPRRLTNNILQTFGFEFEEYTLWLANLYGMLTEGTYRPSLFERIFAAMFENRQTAEIELHRFTDPHACCFFADSSYCRQNTNHWISIGFNIASDMFAIIHFDFEGTNNNRNLLTNPPLPLGGQVKIIDNDHNQRTAFNNLCIKQAREAVYGKSNQQHDYF